MEKVTMGAKTWVYPMPVILVGANIDGKPNFMTVAWGGIAGGDPPMISVALRHQRYTLTGVRQNLTFSINMPSVDMVREADYCGIVSGAKVDKVEACQFKVFYGKLETAPLIEQCPINMECKVVHILDVGSHSLVIGRIEETYISANCLSDGKPDADKLKPLIFVTAPGSQYRAFGQVVAEAFSIGKELEGN